MKFLVNVWTILTSLLLVGKSEASAQCFIFQIVSHDIGCDIACETSYTVTLDGDTIIAGSSFDSYVSEQIEFCLTEENAGCINVELNPSGFPHIASWHIADPEEWLDGVALFSGGPTASTTVSLGDDVCGCMDELASNYDSEATASSGNCDYCDGTYFLFEMHQFVDSAGWPDLPDFSLSVDGVEEFGGTWNSQESSHFICVEDSSCLGLLIDWGQGGWYADWSLTNYVTGEVVLSREGLELDWFDYSYQVEVCFYGCTDQSACNFDEFATEDDGTCFYAAEYRDCEGECLNDVNNNGLCDEEEIVGCTWFFACNWNPEATFGDDSCVYDGCVFCTDESACNYNPDVWYDDGSCIYPTPFFDCDGNCISDVDGDGVCDELEILGCTDVMADNWNSSATDDDGSCVYLIYGCMLEYACNYNPDANYPDNSCDLTSCAGCMLETACNYDPEATIAWNYTCTYPDIEYINCDGSCQNDSDGDGVCDEDEIEGCPDPDACNFVIAPTDILDCIYQDALGICGGECLEDADTDGICDDVDPCIGFTDDCGVCNGPGAIYSCGCYEMPEYDCDCLGNQLDVLGVCGGDCTEDVDADGICDDDDDCIGEFDECGVCNGPGAVYDCGCEPIPAGECDCQGNTIDAIGICGGNCEFDDDLDGICDSIDDCVGVIDDCGVCNGIGSVLQCGCYNIPPSKCDCEGNQIDALGICGGDCAWDTNGDGICDDIELGCTYEAACNYYWAAEHDDGSCIFPEPMMNCDGTPLIGNSCLADIDIDGMVSTLDLLIVLSWFGMECE